MAYNELTMCTRLKEWREHIGHSLDLVARCIGTTRQTLSEFEQGNPDKLRMGQILILCRPNVELDGKIIPMMDCEIGYLLGEEGYENRTRVKTDICKATGLSEVAVSALDSRREITIDIDIATYKNMGYDDAQISNLMGLIVSSAKRKHTLLLNVIEKLVTSKYTERIISELESALDSREVYANIIKRMENFMHSEEPVLEKSPILLYEACSTVEHEGMCILPSDKAEEYFINESSLAFKELLKEMLSQEKEC